MNRFINLLISEESIRLRTVRGLIRRIGLLRNCFTLDDAITYGLVERPHYAFCMLHGASLAQRLGHRRMTAIEFGVAGGRGLVAMEAIAALVEAETGVGIDIVGFDNAIGMPAPVDHRDIPYHWNEGHFPMDEAALRQRLKRSTLVIGDISTTLSGFDQLSLSERPVGAVVFDVDYYSSTIKALPVFDFKPVALLPRIACFFDDMSGEKEVASDFTGVRAAIADFNDTSKTRKITPFYGARDRYGLRGFRDGLMCFHKFDHSDYCKNVGGDDPADSTLSLE